MRKGIIAALVIFIGLGLYVFLVEKNKPLSVGREVVLKFEKDKAEGLIIRYNQKEIVLDKDKEGKWQIISPLSAKADDNVVNVLVGDISSLEAGRSLEVAPSEWKDFGLKEPGIEVSVLIGGRKERLFFGDKNPGGYSVYTRVSGKDKIFLVSSYIADSFKKDLSELKEAVESEAEKEKSE